MIKMNKFIQTSLKTYVLEAVWSVLRDRRVSDGGHWIRQPGDVALYQTGRHCAGLLRRQRDGITPVVSISTPIYFLIIKHIDHWSIHAIHVLKQQNL